MVRKTSVNRPADLLNDCTAQQVSVVLASARANPSCKQKQVGKSKQEKKVLVPKYLIGNNLSTIAWIKSGPLKRKIATSVQRCHFNKVVSRKEQM